MKDQAEQSMSSKDPRLREEMVKRLREEANWQEQHIKANRGWRPSGMNPDLLREAAAALARPSSELARQPSAPSDLVRECRNCGTTLARCYDCRRFDRKVACCPECDHAPAASSSASSGTGEEIPESLQAFPECGHVQRRMRRADGSYQPMVRCGICYMAQMAGDTYMQQIHALEAEIATLRAASSPADASGCRAAALNEAADYAKRSNFVDGPKGTVEGQIAAGIRLLARQDGTA